MAVKPENARLLLANDILRLLMSAGVKFLGSQGEISSAANPASLTSLAASGICRLVPEKCSAHDSSKICDQSMIARGLPKWFCVVLGAHCPERLGESEVGWNWQFGAFAFM